MAQLHKKQRQLRRTLLLTATGIVRLTLISISNLKSTLTWWRKLKSQSSSSIFYKRSISKATFSKGREQAFRSLKIGTTISNSMNNNHLMTLLFIRWTWRQVLWSTHMKHMSSYHKTLTTIRLSKIILQMVTIFLTKTIGLRQPMQMTSKI